IASATPPRKCQSALQLPTRVFQFISTPCGRIAGGALAPPPDAPERTRATRRRRRPPASAEATTSWAGAAAESGPSPKEWPHGGARAPAPEIPRRAPSPSGGWPRKEDAAPPP